jgi:hypothetical protein
MRFHFLLCVAAVFLLSGCGGGGSPPGREGATPGADRQVQATDRLPPPPADRPHDAAITPSDDTRSARVGSTVTARGGQKAQREKDERDRAGAAPGRDGEPGDEPGDTVAPSQ